MEERQRHLIKEVVQDLDLEGKTPDDAIKYLNGIKEKLNPMWDYSIWFDYQYSSEPDRIDCMDVTAQLIVWRPENDEEFKARKEKEKKEQQYQKQKDEELKVIEGNLHGRNL